MEFQCVAEFESFFDFESEIQHEIFKEILSDDGFGLSLDQNGDFFAFHINLSYLKKKHKEFIKLGENFLEMIESKFDEDEEPENNIKRLEPFQKLLSKALNIVNGHINDEKKRLG